MVGSIVEYERYDRQKSNPESRRSCNRFPKIKIPLYLPLSPNTMSTSYEEIKDFAYELAERVCFYNITMLMDRLPRSSWRDQLLDGLIQIMPKLRRIRLM
jgi:hypothetical protein